MTETYTYAVVKEIADFINSKTGNFKPEIGIVCGSGLGNLADQIVNPIVINYKDIPHFPISTVHGHAGHLVLGKIGSKPVVCMKGRFHAYEGYGMEKVVLPIRVMKLLGIEILIVTNAAGGLNPEYKVGDIMIIKDHIALPAMSGKGPLVGHNEELFGDRFVALSDAYDRDLRDLSRKTLKRLGYDFAREGVYCWQIGPFYETVSECRYLRNIGGDVVGMSTAPEVMVARHCGIRVMGFSLVTNECILEYDSNKKANHKEVLETSNARSLQMCKLVSEICSQL